ncbi:glycosyltransferase family 2 protein [Prochlorococcus sp. MIT 1341]|uniref:glycosyltransferase n=1 Tax=Prochlorococcus sp. MIT 1341 TaxID=3096221 RepID=UPI002A75F60E|nr:glycosyltransferase family 2 protein [Prochlorococcus sp. MIT 1341]
MTLRDLLPLLFAVVIATQVILVAFFKFKIKQLQRGKTFRAGEPYQLWPEVEVVLCLRGADKTLPGMLNSLSKQNYPGLWRLKIVVDSASDHAWAIVQEMIDSEGKNNQKTSSWAEAIVEVLEEKETKGSLKCASIRQAFKGLHPNSKVVALVDSDAVVPSDWLKTLVYECCQENIGAVSGNRWYEPTRNTLSACTRKVWNAGALVMMTIFKIPWGGSLAVKRELINSDLWVNLLESSLCEDTCLHKPLKELNLEYRFIPELLIIDRSYDITMPGLAKWLSRQVLTVRLHHPAWPLIMIHGLGTTLVLVLGLFSGTWFSLIVYELSCLLLLGWIEVIARNKTPKSTRNFAFSLIAGQLINGWSTLMALVAKEVEWRGINYKITLNPKGVERLQD